MMSRLLNEISLIALNARGAVYHGWATSNKPGISSSATRYVDSAVRVMNLSESSDIRLNLE